MLSVNSLLQKKLLIFTGKGGIGKSLVTGAFGQLAAEHGLRTLLVERSEQDQLAPLFGVEKAGHQEVVVGKNLSCINLDPTKCFEEYVVKQLGKKRLFEKVFSHTVVKTFLNTIPGLSESVMLGRIFYSCELATQNPYDLVLFDAPAFGHMHNLMTTPDAIINSGIGGPFVREVSRVRDFLSDSDKVGSVLVTVPEELVIRESMEFLPKMESDIPAKLVAVLINRAYGKASDPEIDELEQMAKGNSSLGPAAEFLVNRFQRVRRNQKDLISKLDQIDESGGIGQYALLPDLGIVEEPFPKGFGEAFFAELATV